jgi:hypothetical protein
MTREQLEDEVMLLRAKVKVLQNQLGASQEVSAVLSKTFNWQ